MAKKKVATEVLDTRETVVIPNNAVSMVEDLPGFNQTIRVVIVADIEVDGENVNFRSVQDSVDEAVNSLEGIGSGYDSSYVEVNLWRLPVGE